MNYSPHQLLVLEKTKEKNRRNSIKDLLVHELHYLEYPNHRTAVYVLSKVEDPDYAVIYTYGGTIPHMFSIDENDNIVEACKIQFTWEWMQHWLNQNVAVIIFDMPDYFKANMSTPSFYRISNDRMRESLALVDLVNTRFPESKIAWHGLSYGCHEAARMSQVDSLVEKTVLSSAPWHVLDDVDQFHQGLRMDWFNTDTVIKPMLVVQHITEKHERAAQEMSKFDSVTVTNNVTEHDGHFFRKRQAAVVKLICDWLRSHPIPKEIP
jgi:hypothetical protein